MNNSVLAFHRSKEHADRFKPWVYGEVYPLRCPDNTFLTFQVPRSPNNAPLFSFKLYRLDDTGEVDITTEMAANFVEIKNFGAYDMIIGYYKGNQADRSSAVGGFSNGFSDGFSRVYRASDPGTGWIELDPGFWYAVMSDAVNMWYSEAFLVVPAKALKNCTKLTWSNSKDIRISDGERLYYGSGFTHELWMDTAIGKPQYPFEEEVIDRDGHPFVIKQVSEKRYNFEILAPEYLCDALRLIRMHTYIFLQLNDWETVRIEDILVTPEWQKNGNVAVVKIEFETDTVVFNSGVEDVPQIQSRISVKGEIDEDEIPIDAVEGDRYIRRMPGTRMVYIYDGEGGWNEDETTNQPVTTLVLPDGSEYQWKK